MDYTAPEIARMFTGSWNGRRTQDMPPDDRKRPWLSGGWGARRDRHGTQTAPTAACAERGGGWHTFLWNSFAGGLQHE